MNNDLISRDYVEKIISSEFVDLQDGTEEWRTYVNDTCENILNKVDNAPTVAVNCKDCDGYEAGYSAGLKDAERPQGEWIDEGQYAEGHDEHAYVCKKCGYQIIENPNMIYENRFCKYCGADMRGKE